MGEGKSKISRGLVIKIIVPLMILLGVIAIWLAKNYNVLSRDNKTVADKIGLGEDAADASEFSYYDLNVTEEIDLEQLKTYGIPIVIDFGADTCIPCKEMAPVLEKLNEELRGKAIILFVDVRKYPDIATNFPISIIPTQILIDKDGKPYVPTESNSAGMIMYSTNDTEEHVFTTHEGGLTEEALLEILFEMGLKE